MSSPDSLERDQSGWPRARVVITWSGADRPDRNVTMVVTLGRGPAERTSVLEVPDRTQSFPRDLPSDSRWMKDSLDDRDEQFTEVPLLATAQGHHPRQRRATSQRRAPDPLALERPGDRSPWLTLGHLLWGTPTTRRASAVLGAAVAVLGTIAVLSGPSNGDAGVATQPPSTTTTAAAGVRQVDAAAFASTSTDSACESLSASGWIGGLYTSPFASDADTRGTTDAAFSPADCLPTPPLECPPGSPPTRGDG